MQQLTFIWHHFVSLLIVVPSFAKRAVAITGGGNKKKNAKVKKVPTKSVVEICREAMVLHRNEPFVQHSQAVRTLFL